MRTAIQAVCDSRIFPILARQLTSSADGRVFLSSRKETCCLWRFGIYGEYRKPGRFPGMFRCIQEMSSSAHSAQPPFWPRVRQATGTVYGDIGTSVLYTIMEITRETVLLRNHHLGHAAAASLVASGGDLLTKNDLLGGLSLVFWALIFFDREV